MKVALQLGLALALFAATAVAALADGLFRLAALSLVALIAHAALSRSLRQAGARMAPVLLFSAVLAGAEWLAGGVATTVPLKAFAVCLLASSGARALPLDAVLRAIAPGSPFFRAALFFLLVRHFERILVEEITRLLRARALAAPRRFGAGWMPSLAFAAASVFSRTLERAERFYACQLLRGVAD